MDQPLVVVAVAAIPSEASTSARNGRGRRYEESSRWSDGDPFRHCLAAGSDRPAVFRRWYARDESDPSASVSRRFEPCEEGCRHRPSCIESSGESAFPQIRAEPVPPAVRMNAVRHSAAVTGPPDRGSAAECWNASYTRTLPSLEPVAMCPPAGSNLRTRTGPFAWSTSRCRAALRASRSASSSWPGSSCAACRRLEPVCGFTRGSCSQRLQAPARALVAPETASARAPPGRTRRSPQRGRD